MKNKDAIKPKRKFENPKIEILFEDQYIIVINKPNGILSVPYSGSHSRTALDYLEKIMRKNGTYSSNHKPLVVHRLDRDTSGVMMFATTEISQKKIIDSWHKMVTERLYVAVSENPTFNTKLENSGLIDSSLAYNARNIAYVPQKDEKVKTVPARTFYKIIEKGNAYTMFELNLDTGKKNQIRAHLASKGYPIVGDENYRANSNPFSRLALHAKTLEFDHPFTNEHLKFEVAEPSKWIDFVKKTKNVLQNFGNSTNQKKNIKTEKTFDQQKRYTRKDFRGKDFIAQGKMKSH